MYLILICVQPACTTLQSTCRSWLVSSVHRNVIIKEYDVKKYYLGNLAWAIAPTNPHPPRMFLFMDFFYERWIEPIESKLLYVHFVFSTRLSCMGAQGLATDCHGLVHFFRIWLKQQLICKFDIAEYDFSFFIAFHSLSLSLSIYIYI